ncbi:MAG: serine/threonine protein kinase, partial [Myxococcales bacterium]|nr:serine/threonine protein kinase [Myxococcales bacterium]
MTDTMHERTQQLLLTIIQQDPEEWDTYVNKLSDGDKNLQDILKHMLASVSEADHYFESLTDRLGVDHVLDKTLRVAGHQVPSMSKKYGTEHLDNFFAAFHDPDSINYQIESEYGRGGLGRVLAARDLRLGRVVAIKEMLHDHPELRKRFAQEALITAQLEHPSIVPVYDVGVWSGGKPYYTMKLVHGRSLNQLVCERRSLDERLPLLTNMLMVADAVAYAHSKQVIHRDLKPDNVIMGDYGESVVIDWGLAKHLQSHNEIEMPMTSTDNGALTQQGTVLGTPVYMPPEQARGEEVDQRADVYALGAMLYYLLSGEPPYSGESSKDILHKVETQSPAPLDTFVSVKSDLVTVINKAMAREPADRYADAKELRDELQRYQDGQLVRAHRYPLHQQLWRKLRRSTVPIMITAIIISVGLWALTQAYERYRFARLLAACDRNADRIAEVWNNRTREAVRSGILESEPESGPAIVTKLLPWLERSAAAWRAHAQRACINDTVHKRWSAESTQKSQWCLTTRRSELAALVTEL